MTGVQTCALPISHGHFNGEPGLPDAAAARRAILFLLKTVSDIKAIVLIRDQDDQPDRRDGLEQARNQNHGQVVIVVGLAVVERECWVISGYDPRNEAESARLEAETKQLGFDPRVQSHHLTAYKNDQAKHSAKRILRELSGNERERERGCWRETDLLVLRDRGDDNGLARFLSEVHERLAKLIGHPSK